VRNFSCYRVQFGEEKLCGFSVSPWQANAENNLDKRPQEFTSKAIVFGAQETGRDSGLHSAAGPIGAKLWMIPNDSFVHGQFDETARILKAVGL